MKLAFLIHAHKEPAVLRRLVGALAGADVWVNLDAKSEIDPSTLGPARLVKKRVDIHWGDFTQIEALLNSLAELEAAGGWDYVAYLSGQDYPVWSVERMVRRLEADAGREFLHFAPLGPGGWDAAERVDYYHYTGSSPALKAGARAARGLMRAAGLKRRLPGGLTPYGGSAWFTLSRACVREILRFDAAHPEYAAFMRRTEIPDEHFVQTIVMNSQFKDKALNDNGRYIDWSEKRPNPKLLREDDFDAIKASGKAICRKVDSLSAALMDRLDAAR